MEKSKKGLTTSKKVEVKKATVSSDAVKTNNKNNQQKATEVTSIKKDHGVIMPADVEKTAKGSADKLDVIEHTENINVQKTIPGRPGISEGPRKGRPEDPDLKAFRDKLDVVDTIVDVCDDEGHYLGDLDLESTVKACCKKYTSVALANHSEKITLDNPDEVLAEFITLSNRYVGRINATDNTMQGVVNKYRINLGAMFNIQKRIIEDCTKLRWTAYIEDNYDLRQLRSIQDYMRLARVPDIIGYAALGKERLIQILKLIEPTKDKNGQYPTPQPIRAFLSEHGCDFNPKEEADIKGMKRDADITVGHEFLRVNGFGDLVTRQQVELLVDSKLEVGNNLLKGLKVLKVTFGDDIEALKAAINRYFLECIADRKVKSIPTPEGEARNLNSKVRSLFDKVAEYVEETEESSQDSSDERAKVLRQLDANKLKDLIEKLQSLAGKMAVA